MTQIIIQQSYYEPLEQLCYRRFPAPTAPDQRDPLSLVYRQTEVAEDFGVGSRRISEVNGLEADLAVALALGNARSDALVPVVDGRPPLEQREHGVDAGLGLGVVGQEGGDLADLLGAEDDDVEDDEGVLELGVELLGVDEVGGQVVGGCYGVEKDGRAQAEHEAVDVGRFHGAPFFFVVVERVSIIFVGML